MPCGFARPRWQVRLRESVPLEEGTPADVNAACHGGYTGRTDVGSYGCFWNLIKETTPKIDHVRSLVAARKGNT